MKKLLLLLIFFNSLTFWSQSIVVNDPGDPESNFTPQELIEEVLIGGNGCGDLEFVLLQENCEQPMTLANRSWGYFDAAGTSFPFQEGVILSTGFARSAEGPNDSDGESGSGNCPTGPWAGDPDLQAILDAQSGDTQTTNNATIFQFTFVPVIDQITFDFIFASEEYENQFECDSQFRDGFAFLLRGPGIPNDSGTAFGGTNIAAIPGSAGVPVSTLSIHSDTFLCGSEIPGTNFFPDLYVSNDGTNNLNEIQFDGYTRSITAEATLMPNELYELKMVIADRGDAIFDSAVFFRAGSFNIGISLPPDMTVSGGNAPCEGEPLPISVPPDPNMATTYRWFVLNPVTGTYNLIPGETSNELVVTNSGTYQIEANIGGECIATDEIVIEFTPKPNAADPDPLFECDELPNDGFATFDLTQRNAQIMNGEPNSMVIWYETFDDAENNTNAIADPSMFINTVGGFQRVYARLQEDSFECFDIVSCDLTVNDSPPITDPISDYVICDNDGDGFEEFDLTSKDSEISNILVNLVLTYHVSEADAQAGVSAIDPAGAYVSGGETVWVRAVNLGGCFTVGSFALVLDTVPAFTVVPEYGECDDDGDGVEEFDLSGQNGVITGGDPDLSVSYHGSEADAQSASAPLPDPYLSGGETVWVRVESNTRGCYGVFAMELVVVPPPEIFEPEPLVFCDGDNDGFGTFVLTDADDQVVGGNPAGNLEVSYHALFSQAQAGTFPLSSPYDNTVPFEQTVYARLLDTATGCYSIAPLRLLVLETPQISDPSALVACDGDGVAVFDLTQAEAEILAGLTGGPYTVGYFEDPALSVAITNATAYPNITNPQTIYVVVGEGVGCTSQTTLELVVDAPPSLTAPDPYVLCDVNGPGDGVEVFDLTTRTFGITGGDPGILVSYHETLDDARTGADPIDPADAHENRDPVTGAVLNPKSVYVRGVDTATGCAQTGGSSGLVLELRVANVPAVDPPSPLEVCDTDGDGFALFDLTAKDMEIMGGDPSITVSYHETLLDAQQGTFALASPYANIVADLQTVWARAEFSVAPNDNGCSSVVPLDLVVLASPGVPPALDPLVACAPGGVAEFDLTEREAEILDGQDPLLYTVSYHETLAGAQGGTGAIADPTSYVNTSNPQTVYVRVGGNANGCASTGEFDLEVREPPVAVQPDPYTVCDGLGEPNDGIAVFDLTTRDVEISGGGIGINVSYYLTAQGAQDGTDPIDPATAHENRDPVTGAAINPQTIYVRVGDASSDCSALTSMTIRVLPNPEPADPDPIELCDVNGPNDGVEVFDLTVRAAQILNGGSWQLGYYETLALAVEGTDPIADPTSYQNTSNPQVVYVRVTDASTEQMCFEVVELELVVSPLPDTGAEVPPLVVCRVPNTGTALFDLTLRDGDVLGGQDPAFFQVSYYEDPGDAALMFDPIPNPGSYPGTDGQVVYPGILDTRTDCYASGQELELRVDDGAVANSPAEPYAVCDNLGDPNDGIAEFILDDPSDPASPAQLLRDGILGGQDPMLFTLTFHETLAAAEAGTGALGPVYVNLANPQVIYARVENDAPENGCSAVAEVVLKVDGLPGLSLEGEYRLCLDADGLPIPPESGGPSPPVLDTGLPVDGYTFSWSVDGSVLVGEVGPSVVAGVPGTYVVTVTDRGTGCTGEYAAEVIASSPPVVFGAVVSEAFAGEPTVTVTAEGLGTYEFQLDGGPFQGDSVFTGVAPGEHTVTIRDVNGCGSVTVRVGVVDYPRFMTPNQDGFHDTWNIIGIAGADPTAKIYIFDRMGKLLKQISPTGEGWDGTYNGNPLPSSDYWFLVEYEQDGAQRQFRGHFTLKR